MRPLALSVVLALGCAAAPAVAQTANSSPTAGRGTGTAGGDATRTAPSGSTAKPNPGTPQIGAPTPLERHEEQKSQQDTTICKGC